MSVLTPIAAGLWTDEAEPRLIGGRLASGTIVFPMPEGDAADGVETWPLSRKGMLWSFTRQDFRPKSPYEGPGEGPHDFEPYLLGYIELPGEVIVESLIVDARLEDLRLGMPMELAIVPFNAAHTTFAFRPESQP
jgi:uncharacterized OB-fold protein